MSTYGPIRNNAKGKGKSKGTMFGTCWTCGGAHYAANCPKGKGKGFNQVGEPEVFDQWEPEEWGSPEIRTPLPCNRDNVFCAVNGYRITTR